MRHSLYRHFSADGALLYVGVSVNAVSRLGGHRRSGWFWDIATITLEHYDTKDEALLAEALAITYEKPLHNGKPSNIKNLHGVRMAVHEPERLLRLAAVVEAAYARYGIPITKADFFPYEEDTK